MISNLYRVLAQLHIVVLFVLILTWLFQAGSVDLAALEEAASKLLLSENSPSIQPPLGSSSSSSPGLDGSYCRVCRIVRPLRAKHCYLCGHCVRKFDHHCPWLGACVGERNHRFFWGFLLTETALLAWGVDIAW